MIDKRPIRLIDSHDLDESSILRASDQYRLIFPWCRPALLRDKVFPRVQDVRLGNPVLQGVRMHHYLKHGLPYFVLRNYTG